MIIRGYIDCNITGLLFSLKDRLNFISCKHEETASGPFEFSKTCIKHESPSSFAASGEN